MYVYIYSPKYLLLLFYVNYGCNLFKLCVIDLIIYYTVWALVFQYSILDSKHVIKNCFVVYVRLFVCVFVWFLLYICCDGLIVGNYAVKLVD